jgi:hypothetical protein
MLHKTYGLLIIHHQPIGFCCGESCCSSEHLQPTNVLFVTLFYCNTLMPMENIMENIRGCGL